MGEVVVVGKDGWLMRSQACRVMDGSTEGKGMPVHTDARVISTRASAAAMLLEKESGHSGEAVIPAGLPKFTEVRGRGFREVLARIHERDHLPEAFLATGACPIPRRLSGRAMGPRQPRQAAGRGSLPRFGPVEFKVVRRCRVAEGFPKLQAAQGTVLTPEDVSEFMHGEPVSQEGGRVASHVQPGGRAVEDNLRAAERTIPFRGDREARHADTAGPEVGRRLVDCIAGELLALCW